MLDKRMTEDEVVAELRDGMTLGIGGWPSRRKPMSFVRAIARSKLREDLVPADSVGYHAPLLSANPKPPIAGFVSMVGATG